MGLIPLRSARLVGPSIEYQYLTSDPASRTPVHGPGCTVSYLPVYPPPWARLSSDPFLYDELPPIRHPADSPFRLDPVSACCWCPSRSKFDPTRPVYIRRSKLYTLLSAHDVEVEVQACPVCPAARRRSIGPDLRTVGVFNFNNSVLVSHELLDEYTSAYTTSETPFASWVLQISRRYERANARFMSEKTFRSVWFAYASLQHFVDDMSCNQPECGEAPETSIWDGITLAFGKKHLNGSLRPPTYTVDASAVRGGTKYQPRQQLFPDAALRRQIRLALKGPSLEGFFDEEPLDHGAVSDTTTPSTPTRRASRSPSKSPSKSLLGKDAARQQTQRQALLVKDHLSRLDTIALALGKECPSLSTLFTQYFGPVAYAASESSAATKILKNLFSQVGSLSILIDFDF